MKKTILALLSLVAIGIAQDRKVAITNASPTGEHELTPLKPMPAKSGEKLCGPYFVLLTEYKGTNQPGIMFMYKSSDQGVSLMGMMSKSKFMTVIDNTKKIPTAKVVSSGEGVIDKNTIVVIRISKQDFNETKDCLPKP